MKKILLITLLILSSFTFNAQEVFSFYKNSYVKNEYPIHILDKGNGDYILNIDAFSLDSSVNIGGIYFSKEEHIHFLKMLKFTQQLSLG
jgi:hypothetical protein